MDTNGIPAHGGERVAAALAANGVRFIFTLCGGHISPILVAAKARGIGIIDTRDEATAVFAADAVARLTGTTGVAAVTAGPGLTNTITALKNAQLAQSPVLLLGGAAPTALQGRGALQDIAQKPLIAPHVKWLKQVRRVADLGAAVEEALVVAREGVPGPTFVECPVDLLYDEKLIRGWYADAAGKGKAIADRMLRWYLGRHAARMFAGSGAAYVPVARAVPDNMLLAVFLRETLGLTGTHVGCDTTQCGCCVVHVDGRSVKSCTMLAAQADGCAVTTIEGLATGDVLHPVQRAFHQFHALQCGYCTPGMIMAATNLIETYEGELTEETVREQMEGNLCRCTGYHNIVKAILAAADDMRSTRTAAE